MWGATMFSVQRALAFIFLSDLIDIFFERNDTGISLQCQLSKVWAQTGTADLLKLIRWRTMNKLQCPSARLVLQTIAFS